MSRRDVAAETLQSASAAFGLDPDRLVFVRDVANIVHADGEPGRAFLRLTHEDDRSPADVAAEIDWLRLLGEEGLRVCRPRPAQDGRAVVRPGEGFTAVVFERVPGRPCELTEFGPPVFQRMGAFLGRLHRVSRDYAPRAGVAERLPWWELDSPERVLASWGDEDAFVAERFREVFERVRGAPRPTDRFGLIHGDVHRGNLFLDGDDVAIYDFDDCCRAPLAMDLAHALYYSLWDYRYLPESERSAFARGFLEALLRGYRDEYALPEADLDRIPDLLELRELAVDAFSHRRLRQDPETYRRWAHVRDRLARGAPYVELDWARLRG